MTNDLQASLEAARPPAQMTPEQESLLRTLAPQIGGLEGALLRLLLGCYDADRPIAQAAHEWARLQAIARDPKTDPGVWWLNRQQLVAAEATLRAACAAGEEA